MQPDYLADVQPLEADHSDAAIVLHLAGVTTHPVAIADAENFLHFRGLASRDPRTGAWQGVLPDLIDAADTPAEIAAGLAELFAHINKPRSVHIDTTALPWSTDAAALLGGLVALGAISSDDRAAFYDLADGRRFPAGVTIEAIEAMRIAHANDAAKDAITAATLETLEAPIRPLRNKANAAATWLATADKSAYTLEQWQAFADELLASDDGNPAGGA